MAAPIESKFSLQNLKNIKLDDVMYRFMPAVGGASYLAFSVNIMNPRLYKNLFAPHELLVSNKLWFNAHLGVGLYLYSRKHMITASAYQRIMYSIFGTVVFNFGSVLLWATTKALLPECVYMRSFFGLISGTSLLLIGKEYVAHLDKKCINDKPAE
ncbi:uncharacterized protein LOC141904190 [Tubulanus polymorphus]|uniref:uncharacterized protein LOC141904190 n=1 Tax=Tubulanus polymorphus TaxID=672921 RepID=UPI003DA59B7D